MSTNIEDEKLVLDVDEASALKSAFRVAGWDAKQVRKFASGGHCRALRSVIDGYAEIRPREYIVDLGAIPKEPKSHQNKLVLKKHVGAGTATLTREGDTLFLDDKKINLFVWKGQRKGCLSGEIDKAVGGMLVLNVNVARCIASHPFLIPKRWCLRFRKIFFWGTRFTSEIWGDYVVVLDLSHLTGASVWYEPICHIEYGGGGIITDCSPSAILER